MSDKPNIDIKFDPYEEAMIIDLNCLRVLNEEQKRIVEDDQDFDNDVFNARVKLMREIEYRRSLRS